jgi:hypothetical protein
MPFDLSVLGVKILAGLALVAALLLGYGLWSAHEQSIGAAEVKAQAAEQALAATQENLRESTRRVVAVNQKATDADQAASAARADADAAHSAGERLRLRLAAAERGRAADHSSAADPGASAASPSLVPYDVFEGVRSAGEQLAGYADQLRISLDACVGSYSSLTSSSSSGGGSSFGGSR